MQFALRLDGFGIAIRTASGSFQYRLLLDAKMGAELSSYFFLFSSTVLLKVQLIQLPFSRSLDQYLRGSFCVQRPSSFLNAWALALFSSDDLLLKFLLTFGGILLVASLSSFDA